MRVRARFWLARFHSDAALDKALDLFPDGDWGETRRGRYVEFLREGESTGQIMESIRADMRRHHIEISSPDFVEVDGEIII